MKKKLLAVVLAATMALSLVACGGQNTGNGNTGTESTGSESAVTEEAGTDTAVSGEGLKIGLVTDTGGVEDQSFNQSAWEGLQKAAKDFGVEVNYLSSSTDADYAPNIETFIDEDYDLIISVGFLLADATRAAAEANPDVNFAIIDDSSCADLANVTCLTFKQEQASYLVGYVAGLMTEKDNVGFVLGMASDVMHLFGYGYCAGVLDANPNAKIQQGNANNFGDPAMGTTLTTNFVTNGADVVFHAAGATGTGVISECQSKGIMAIGVDSDQSYLAPETVITSAMKRVDNAVYSTVSQLAEGTLKGGVAVYDLTNEGVDIAPTTDLLPEEVVTAVNEVKEKIISGEITVPDSKDAFEAAYGDVYELD
ncbi:MAG: BMP family ABC transporter substrate-binding protein [Lachnospiraceae bacterium]|nr:BMP family ABC transporter substrate-binding protein [Lachnospiraceae bacterium]MCI7594623.1 BMP family ABC transporter substrate-binding protein [Lachnospiraceae bacterium]MDD7050257.1 BMP family ABC transporter substrate-binding protein [Lachnospiraceae bacterium]MDY3222028.1 BMP family ABC transporter substrate-binding protein [Lachnospiraceae bacterium]MDY4095396.1 BMP family ABC transporter substrate-binding protein [Lachnospiraceae bacterium]